MVTFELFLTIRQPLWLMLMTTTLFEIICLILVSGSAYALYDPLYHVYFAPHNQVWVKPLNWPSTAGHYCHKGLLLAAMTLLSAERGFCSSQLIEVFGQVSM